MEGKLCVVTGANTGIGKATAQGLLARGATVVMACRNPTRGQAARDQLIEATSAGDRLELMTVDLSALDSIAAFASTLAMRFASVDVLVNNAGVWMDRRRETDDGFEMTFGVNHLGTFALTNQLMPLLLKADAPRVVTVSSDLHYRGRIPFDDLHYQDTFKGSQAYADSKLANVLFSAELARRGERHGLIAHSLHPGVVRTELARHSALFNVLAKLASPFLLSPAAGAATSLHVACDPEPATSSGKYFAKSRIKEPSRQALDAGIARRLWRLSAEMTGVEDERLRD